MLVFKREVDRLKWLFEKICGSRLKDLWLLIGAGICLALFLGGVNLVNDWGSKKYQRKDNEFNTLPVAPREFVTDSPLHIEIEDQSPWAKDETLTLNQYTCSYYEQDMLTEQADYNRDGRMTQVSRYKYDTAGNIRWEQVIKDTGQPWIRNHFYEYDHSGRVVHEEIYEGKELAERSYFRYTDLGCAGVSYSYLDEKEEGSTAGYCTSRTEFLEDKEGNLLCCFEFGRQDNDVPDIVWRMQWDTVGDQMVNRVQYFERRSGQNQSDWYQSVIASDMEQINLYVYNPETSRKNLTLQLNYEWLRDDRVFALTPFFYRAQYDGDHLLWQISYEDDRVQYYSACQYDEDGRLQTAVEYVGDDAPYALFHRYEYPVEEGTLNYFYGERLDINDLPQVTSHRQEHYCYEIDGPQFIYTAEDGSHISLMFSDEGMLAGIEMTDVSGNILEGCEFCESGKDAGELEKMYINGAVVEGIDAIMDKLEEEAGTDTEGRTR